jgi:hypothetical protein
MGGVEVLMANRNECEWKNEVHHTHDRLLKDTTSRPDTLESRTLLPSAGLAALVLYTKWL